MVLVALGVIFAGYTLEQFGWYSLKGPGVGFLDLLAPSRVQATQAKIQQLKASAGGTASPSMPGETVNPNGSATLTPRPGGPLAGQTGVA